MLTCSCLSFRWTDWHVGHRDKQAVLGRISLQYVRPTHMYSTLLILCSSDVKPHLVEAIEATETCQEEDVKAVIILDSRSGVGPQLTAMISIQGQRAICSSSSSPLSGCTAVPADY